MSEYEAGFVRQRRGLITISVVLTIVVWFGLEGCKLRVGPGGGTGLTVDFGDARYVYWGLYAAYLWLLIRYSQYFVQLRESVLEQLDKEQYSRINSAFARRLHDLAVNEIIEVVRPKYPENTKIVIGGLRTDAPVERKRWKAVQKTFTANLRVRGHGADTVKYTASISGLSLYWPLLKAITPVNIRQPYFTEYILPLVFALPPLLLLPVRWREVFLSASCGG